MDRQFGHEPTHSPWARPESPQSMGVVGSYAQMDPPTAPIPVVPARPNFFKRNSARLIKHPFWAIFGAIIGIVGIVVSIIQLMDSGSPYTPAELEVAIVAMGSPEEIDGTITYPGNDTSSTTLTAAPVDITLKNNGTQPSLITEVQAEVVFAAQLHDCALSGAGPGLVSAFYSIKLPTAETGKVELGTQTTSMRFEVKPGSVDRMSLTIGPEQQSWATSYPRVMAVHLTLIHDGSQKLNVGTVALATTGKDVQTQIERAHDSSCAAEDLEVLDKLYEIQAYRAPDLDRLRKKYQQLAQH
jgi:hypothetical protein